MGIGPWSLTTLQQRPVKTGGRLVKHARYYWLLLAKPSYAAAVRGHSAADRVAALAGWLDEPVKKRLSTSDPGTEGQKCQDPCTLGIRSGLEGD